MKKLLIIFLVFFLTFFPYLKSQSQSSVPVNEGVVRDLLGQTNAQLKVMSDLITTLINEMNKLNVEVGHLFQLQTRDIMSNELLKQLFALQSFNDIYQQSVNLVQELTVDDENDIAEELDESAAAGIIIGLEKFVESVQCLKPEVKSELKTRLKSVIKTVVDSNINTDRESYSFDKMIDEKLESIPDCYSLNTFSWQQNNNRDTKKITFNIFSPFNLSSLLAQIFDNNQNQLLSEFSIVPAFQETENNMLLSSLETNAYTNIVSETKFKINQRKNQLWGLKPLTEECINKKYEFTDKGKAICLEYRPEITVNHLKDFLKNVNNPLQSNILNEFAVTLPNQSLFYLGLNQAINTTSTIQFSVNNPLINSSTIQKIVNEYCQMFTEKKSDEKTKQKGFETFTTDFKSRCLGTFASTTLSLLEIRKKFIEENKKYITEVKNVTNSIEQRIKNLEEQLGQCNNTDQALRDLAVIKGKLQIKIGVLDSLLSKIIGIETTLNTQFENLLRTINTLQIQINEIIARTNQFLPIFQDNTFKDKLFNISNVFFDTLKNLFGSILEGLLESSTGAAIEEVKKMTKEVVISIEIYKTNILKGLADEVFKQNLDIEKQFNIALTDLNDLLANFNNMEKDILKNNANILGIKNVEAEIIKITRKLDGYESLLARKQNNGECNNNALSFKQTKTKKIVTVDNKNTSVSFIDKLVNIFSSRIVEMSFKR